MKENAVDNYGSYYDNSIAEIESFIIDAIDITSLEMRIGMADFSVVHNPPIEGGVVAQYSFTRKWAPIELVCFQTLDGKLLFCIADHTEAM